MTDCLCFKPPLNYSDFDQRNLKGYDETDGRFGEVSIETCKHCGTKWLRYFVEYEAFTKSGRWYRGVVSDEVSEAVTLESAVSILEGLDWWIRGGSYFISDGKKGKKGRGRLNLGL
jgi:hypothetical protein